MVSWDAVAKHKVPSFPPQLPLHHTHRLRWVEGRGGWQGGPQWGQQQRVGILSSSQQMPYTSSYPHPRSSPSTTWGPSAESHPPRPLIFANQKERPISICSSIWSGLWMCPLKRPWPNLAHILSRGKNPLGQCQCPPSVF